MTSPAEVTRTPPSLYQCWWSTVFPSELPDDLLESSQSQSKVALHGLSELILWPSFCLRDHNDGHQLVQHPPLSHLLSPGQNEPVWPWFSPENSPGQNLIDSLPLWTTLAPADYYIKDCRHYHRVVEVSEPVLHDVLICETLESLEHFFFCLYIISPVRNLPWRLLDQTWDLRQMTWRSSPRSPEMWACTVCSPRSSVEKHNVSM